MAAQAAMQHGHSPAPPARGLARSCGYTQNTAGVQESVPPGQRLGAVHDEGPPWPQQCKGPECHLHTGVVTHAESSRHAHGAAVTREPRPQHCCRLSAALPPATWSAMQQLVTGHSVRTLREDATQVNRTRLGPPDGPARPCPRSPATWTTRSGFGIHTFRLDGLAAGVHAADQHRQHKSRTPPLLVVKTTLSPWLRAHLEQGLHGPCEDGPMSNGVPAQ